jgi:hypothetical protein
VLNYANSTPISVDFLDEVPEGEINAAGHHQGGR